MTVDKRGNEKVINSPCKECRMSTPEKHYLGCHADCEAYIAYKAENERIKQAFNRDYAIAWTVSSESQKSKWSKRSKRK